MRQDIQCALRALRQSPLFTAVALLSLAIGIGANTAMFSVIDAILLRPMPFANPEELVILKSENSKRGLSFTILSPAEIRDYKAESDIFAAVTAYRQTTGFLTDSNGGTQRVNGIQVDPDFFNVLQYQPAIGRPFNSQDSSVVILQHGYWRQHFASDPQIVGKTITLSDTPRTIVGVMPERFQAPDAAKVDVLVPLVLTPAQNQRGVRFLSVIARIKSGRSAEQAQERMTALSNALAEKYPEDQADWAIRLENLQESVVGESRLSLMVLFGAVFAVLLIASTNVASLMSSRGTSRRSEIAIRAALGASRARITRQILVESSLLSVIGGVVGLVLARVVLDAFVARVPDGIPRLGTVSLDGRVLAFNFALIVITTLLFGWLPAREASRTDPNRYLGTGRPNGEGARSKARSALVVVEVAATLVLVTGAALLLNSFVRLQSVDVGLKADNVVTFSVSGPPSSGARKPEFMQTLLTRLKAHPDVQVAAVSGVVPMRGFKMVTPVRFPQGGEFSQKSEDMAALNYVTADYFKLFGIPVLQGRSFEPQADRANDPKVMVVNESLARRFFNGNPIGRRVRVPGPQLQSAEIVGVVGDFHQTSPGEPVKLEMYVPIEQQADAGSFVAVRTQGDTSAVMGSVSELVRSIDPRVVVEQMATVDQLMWDSVAEERFRTLLVTTYSALAIVLSVIGVYSVVAYSTSRRRREIGIRMALGGANRKILAMLLWQGFTPCLVGIILGFFGSIAAARSIQSLLFGVTPMDPLTLAASVSLVALTGLSACAVPAYRALSVPELKSLL